MECCAIIKTFTGQEDEISHSNWSLISIKVYLKLTTVFHFECRCVLPVHVNRHGWSSRVLIRGSFWKRTLLSWIPCKDQPYNADHDQRKDHPSNNLDRAFRLTLG